MRGDSILVRSVLLALCVLLALVTAECPNGCSGNGDCMSKDMCNCYKNFEGNDCADRTCPFGRSFVDTPRGDLNMDQNRKTANWILSNSQQAPEGTYEYFKPDAQTDEAHFYLECSNKGICDRATGLCQCFDGYEGAACGRTTCPTKCSGHGTCESIRELGSKAGGTLFGVKTAAGAVTYDLWDSNSTYGCRCDPWHYSPDCSKRNCKVGVDPLFLSLGTARYETFIIHAYMVSSTNALPVAPKTNWLRLRLFDYYGESYITSKITILDDATAGNGAKNAAAVAAAIKAVPNLTYRDVKCSALAVVGSEFRYYKSGRETDAKGLTVICQFSDNPGKMRIPEVASFAFEGATDPTKAFVVTTSQQGQDHDWFTQQSTYLVGSVATDGSSGVTTITLASGDPSAALNGNNLIKIGPHILMASAATATTVVLTYPFYHSLASNVPIFTVSPDISITLTEVSPVLSVAVNVGDDFLKFSTAPNLATGDTIFYYNAFYTIQQTWSTTGPTAFFVRLNKPFGGNTADGTTGAPKAVGPPIVPAPFKVQLSATSGKGFNYVSECSGRGLCSYETGICTCFKGYTNDNCDTQNILAL